MWNYRSFENEEWSISALKGHFLSNLLLWVKMYIDVGPTSLIHFDDWLGLAKEGCFCSTFSAHCVCPVYLGALFFGACLYILYNLIYAN